MKQYFLIVLTAIIVFTINGCAGTSESGESGQSQEYTAKLAIPNGNPFYEEYCKIDSIVGGNCDYVLALLKREGWEQTGYEYMESRKDTYYEFRKTVDSCTLEMMFISAECQKVYYVDLKYIDWDESSEFGRQDIYLAFIQHLHSCYDYEKCQMSCGTYEDFDYTRSERIDQYDLLIERFADVFNFIDWETEWTNSGKCVYFGMLRGYDDPGFPEMMGSSKCFIRWKVDECASL